jgi:hypothetical protein
MEDKLDRSLVRVFTGSGGQVVGLDGRWVHVQNKSTRYGVRMAVVMVANQKLRRPALIFTLLPGVLHNHLVLFKVKRPVVV